MMGPISRILTTSTLAFCVTSGVMAYDFLTIDDRGSGDYRSTLGTRWRLVTDGVMGGVSRGELLPDSVDGRPCLRLRGEVRLENNGGFVQAALDLSSGPAFDASGWSGLVLDVYGNGEQYNLHLRTSRVWLPWQSYRAAFNAQPRWQKVHLPFTGFTAYRIGAELDLKKLERIGIVAIGRAFRADLCVANIALYRETASAPGS
jgi:hypothetical protein